MTRVEIQYVRLITAAGQLIPRCTMRNVTRIIQTSISVQEHLTDFTGDQESMADLSAELPLLFQTIATAFSHLKEAVRVALQTQLGDVARLDEQI
jgi:hypothetical protein